MNTVSNYRVSTNLLILDSKYYEKCSKQMTVLFEYQEIFKMTKNGVTPLREEAIQTQKSYIQGREEK